MRKYSGILLLLFISPAMMAQGLQVLNNAHFILNGNVKLVLSNASLVNNGNFTAGNASTVIFTGNQLQTIGGTSPVSFQNITVSKNNGTSLQLNSDITVRGAITMTSGSLNVNNNTMNLGDNATIVGESPNSAIVGTGSGKISLTRVLNSPVTQFNPGNIGIELTTRVAPGTTKFERTSKQERLSNGRMGIMRGYNIEPARNTGLGATAKFFYADADLAGIREADLVVWRQTPPVNIWTHLGRDGISTTANWVSKSNLSSLGKFTLGGSPSSNAVLSNAQVYPNPSLNEFTVELTSDKDQDVELTLYDQAGRLIQKKKVFLHEGTNQVKWNFGTAVPGIYRVVFGSNQLPVIKK